MTNGQFTRLLFAVVVGVAVWCLMDRFLPKATNGPIRVEIVRPINEYRPMR